MTDHILKNHNKENVGNYLNRVEKDFLNKKPREKSVKEKIYGGNIKISNIQMSKCYVNYKVNRQLGKKICNTYGERLIFVICIKL